MVPWKTTFPLPRVRGSVQSLWLFVSRVRVLVLAAEVCSSIDPS